MAEGDYPPEITRAIARHYRRKETKRRRAREGKKQRRWQMKEWIARHKRETGCQRCGSRDKAVHELTYHHRDPSQKTASISNMIWNYCSWEALLAEVKKCDVVCKECHDGHHLEEVEAERAPYRTERKLMNDLIPTPAPPDWTIPWDTIEALPWVQPMRECAQDAEYHAEGDVWTHTRMVTEALVRNPAWRERLSVGQQVLFLAALLHDVAKPQTTREEGGRIRAPRHGPVGALLARYILWEGRVRFVLREAVCGLILHHQVPYHFVEKANMERTMIRVSQLASPGMLATLGRADTEGRICEDNRTSFDAIDLFEGYAEELGCLHGRFSFANDHSRVMYFRKEDRNPHYEAFDDTRGTVYVMCGLPGSGKDYWIKKNHPELPMIALDDVRKEMGVGHRDKQGPVVQQARERAKEHLRAGESFIWNTVNLNRTRRLALLNLFLNYNFRVEIVYIEAGPDRLWTQNKDREDAVPESYIRNKLMRIWEVPDITEAHRVHYIVNGEEC